MWGEKVSENKVVRDCSVTKSVPFLYFAYDARGGVMAGVMFVSMSYCCRCHPPAVVLPSTSYILGSSFVALIILIVGKQIGSVKPNTHNNNNNRSRLANCQGVLTTLALTLAPSKSR